MPPPEKKRKTLTLSTKVEIIQAVESNSKKGDVAKTFDIAPSTLSTVLSQKEKIMYEWTKSGTLSQRKKIRAVEYADVDQALVQWFTQQRSANVPINGPMLQEKARHFAEELGYTDFKGSAGFLNSFKVRHGIIFRAVCGDSASANREGAQQWAENILPLLLNEYSEDDIYNADESALFYECLPNRTMAFKGDKCSGGKRSKVRLTLLFCCNMSGSDKRKLLLIGKSAKPRCFKNVDVSRLPVQYTANKKAWMTGDLWNQWLTAFDHSMERAKRKVLLVVDNASSHHRTASSALRAVKLMFLPPNATSMIQPCDQGIIQSFKLHYRTAILRRLLLHLEVTQDVSNFSINILDAIGLCNGAWMKVAAETIQGCFRHAGFVKKDFIDPPIQAEDNSKGEYRNVFSYIQSHFDERATNSAEISHEHYLTVDDLAAVEEMVTDEEIIKTVRENNAPLNNSEDEEEEPASPPPVLLTDALQSVATLRSFFNEKGLPTTTLDAIEQEMAGQVMRSRKQTLITDYIQRE